MSVSVQDLVKSQFYHPALNCAVFDGPVRIYFNQSQESLALKIYFFLQKEVEKILKGYGGSWYFVILLYPDSATYDAKFEECAETNLLDNQGFYHMKTFGSDKLIMTHAGLTDADFRRLTEWLHRELHYLTKVHDENVYAYVV